MPRFVVLEHATSAGTHWDFMLEDGPQLRTWSLAAPPQEGVAIVAHELAPHRLVYLDYEGPISGGRGSVRRWDHGTFQTTEAGPRDAVQVRLEGVRIKGEVRLELQDPSRGQWLFRWESSTSIPAEK